MWPPEYNKELGEGGRSLENDPFYTKLWSFLPKLDSLFRKNEWQKGIIERRKAFINILIY